MRSGLALLYCGLTCLSLLGCSSSNQLTIPTVAPTAFPENGIVTTGSPTGTVVIETAVPVPTPPTAMPTPSPTPCQYLIQLDLTDFWNPEELGCPITPGATAVSTAYAPFEGGQMLWRGDTDIIYVLANDGRWSSYPNAWREGDPEYSCGEDNPLTTPIRGFGRVWCDNPDVREVLGAATAAEIGDSVSTVQDFVNGTILTAPFGDPFVLVGEDAVWRRVEE